MSESSSAGGDVASSAPSSATTPTSTAANSPKPDLNSPQAVAAMQVQQKYAEESSKRYRPEGLSQYVKLYSMADKLKHFEDDPWIDPHAPDVGSSALKDGSRCRFLILGAGFAGLCVAVRLRQAGIDTEDIRIVDNAGGFGGTWYWNRFPGIMCDVESYIYMPLLEEMGYMPKHKYAYGPELREYAESIAQKWELKDKALFRATIHNSIWDDNAKEWVVKITQKRTSQENSDITVRARFVIVAGGLFSSPKLPRIPRIERFQGHSFHTSRWDYDYTGGSPTDPSLTNLRDKKVGIIGTGATAIQVVPHLAKWAKELYVFQRTPSSVDIREQHPTDSEWWAREIQGRKGWQKERMENFNACTSNATPLPSTNMVADGWATMPSYSALVGGPGIVTLDSIPAHIGSLHALDLPRQERIRRRCDEIVQDKTVAEKLKPWYPGWCKRPCFHDDYLPAFNSPNVTLVDTDGNGVDRIAEHAVVVGDTDYDLDLLIFSTGYQALGSGSPAFMAGLCITGRDGQSMDEKWANGVSTLHGVATHGFPNFFCLGPLQAAATPNYTFVLDKLATHIAYIVSEASRRAGPGQTVTIEPTAQAEEDWAMQVVIRAATFAALVGCTPNYMTNEGERDRISSREEQMKAARSAIWGEGVASFVKVIEGWRGEGGMQGLEVEVTAG